MLKDNVAEVPSGAENNKVKAAERIIHKLPTFIGNILHKLPVAIWVPRRDLRIGIPLLLEARKHTFGGIMITIEKI